MHLAQCAGRVASTLIELGTVVRVHGLAHPHAVTAPQTQESQRDMLVSIRGGTARKCIGGTSAGHYWYLAEHGNRLMGMERWNEVACAEAGHLSPAPSQLIFQSLVRGSLRTTFGGIQSCKPSTLEAITATSLYEIKLVETRL